MPDKIKVSMKGIHRALDSLEKKLDKVEKERPGLAKVANLKSQIKTMRNSTKCQINMVLEF